jgi:cell division protein FtsB
MGSRNVMQGLVPRIAVGVFGLMTVAIVLLAIFDDRGVLAVRERRMYHDGLAADVVAAEEKNEELRRQIQDIRHNPDAIERRAREKLKLVKPDEIILEFPKTPAPAR